MWRRIFSALLNILLPRHPRAERAVALPEKSIMTLLAPVQLPRAPWIHALFPYRDEHVRALIQAVKYYGERTVVEKLAPYIADYLTELVAHKTQFEGWEHVRLVPIPASPKRFRDRGYAQASLFAHAVSRVVPDISLDESLLTRAERTSQVHVARATRKQNMQGAFAASDTSLGAYIILLDDVVESGATLSDARRALLDAGARGVVAVAIAH